MLKRREFLFPIAPEPLGNSLFFLYKSSIVQGIATHIKRPETINLRGFYAKVEEMGSIYTFGLPESGAPYTEAKVDVVEALEQIDDRRD
ncbi:hypothetical protein MMC25_004997 [Agyrium rufum]|nr:hypothetical protein [Agyrium rufum]